MTKENTTLSTAPEGYGIVTPWIISSDTTGLLDFVATAFGARDPFSLDIGGGRIGHAETRIGDSVIMGFDAAPEWPQTPAFLRIYVDDADQTVRRACAAGATMVTELGNSAWGDRGARVRDLLGNIWWIMSQVEDVPADEAEARWNAPVYAAGMEYAIRSFDQAMRGKGNHPDDCPAIIRNLPSPARAEGVEPIPAGHKAVEPWIISRDTAGLLDFITLAFGAEEVSGYRWGTDRSAMQKPGSVTPPSLPSTHALNGRTPRRSSACTSTTGTQRLRRRSRQAPQRLRK